MTTAEQTRAPTRVLVVDDSVVVRQVVARVLQADPELELAGVAANGRAALAKLERVQADVIVLDLEMPEMDGFETLAEIRRADPDLPVVIFSHLTSAGASATLEALARGATDFALKPRADGIGLAEAQVRDELIPLIRAVSRHRRPTPVVTAASVSVPPTAARRAGSTRVSAVVIAVSTGGPNALAAAIPELPADLPVPVFIVQHMPALFTPLLAERLDRTSAVTVVEGADGDEVVAGRVYLAPGGRHMSVTGSPGHAHIVLSDGPPENSCRPAADVLFRSAAETYGSETLAVVLTGMGKDGLRGSEAVRAAGGVVVAQSEESCVVASMPAAVAAAGLTDAVVPLTELPAELLRWIGPAGGAGR